MNVIVNIRKADHDRVQIQVSEKVDWGIGSNAGDA